MKNILHKLLLFTMSITCTVLFSGCASIVSQITDADDKLNESTITNETQEVQAESASSSIITDYNWQASGDSSFIVCETDGTFKYYASADDLTNNYYEGTFEFYMGEDAVTYITTTLSDYGVTEEELEGVFDRNEEYEESNFVCFVLNNEACMVDGVNQVESPYQTPYFGFCVETDGSPSLDIANMNSGNSYLFVAK